MEITPVRVGDFLVSSTALLVVSFYLGTLIRLSLRAGNAFRSQVNKYPNRRSYLFRNWDVFLVRTFFATGFFTWWLHDPGAWSKFIAMLGVAPGIANWLTVPPTLATSAGFGFFSDLGIDQVQYRLATKYPWLPDIVKGEIPSYDPAVVDVDSLSKERKVGEPGKDNKE